MPTFSLTFQEAFSDDFFQEKFQPFDYFVDKFKIYPALTITKASIDATGCINMTVQSPAPFSLKAFIEDLGKKHGGDLGFTFNNVIFQIIRQITPPETPRVLLHQDLKSIFPEFLLTVISTHTDLPLQKNLANFIRPYRKTGDPANATEIHLFMKKLWDYSATKFLITVLNTGVTDPFQEPLTRYNFHEYEGLGHPKEIWKIFFDYYRAGLSVRSKIEETAITPEEVIIYLKTDRLRDELKDFDDELFILLLKNIFHPAPPLTPILSSAMPILGATLKQNNDSPCDSEETPRAGAGFGGGSAEEKSSGSLPVEFQRELDLLREALNYSGEQDPTW